MYNPFLYDKNLQNYLSLFCTDKKKSEVVATADSWGLTSQPSKQEVDIEVMDPNDPMWSLVERVTRYLGIEWPVVEQPRRSLFESPSVQPHQTLQLWPGPSRVSAA